MSVERQLVEDYLKQALTEARSVKDDLRLRHLLTFAAHLGAAVIYALGELDNDLWFMIKTINEEVADNMLVLGEVPDDLAGLDLPELTEMSPQQVRERIDDEMNAAEAIIGSENLSATDNLVLGVALKLGGSLVLQLRELNDDECHLTTAIQKGSSQLAQLINRR